MKEMTLEEATKLLERAAETMGQLRSCIPMEPKDIWTNVCLTSYYYWREDYARATKDLGRKP